MTAFYANLRAKFIAAGAPSNQDGITAIAEEGEIFTEAVKIISTGVMDKGEGRFLLIYNFITKKGDAVVWFTSIKPEPPKPLGGIRNTLNIKQTHSLWPLPPVDGSVAVITARQQKFSKNYRINMWENKIHQVKVEHIF